MSNAVLRQESPTDFALPQPPTLEEKYWYMGRQHRWLLAVQAVSFSLIAYSIARFATADTRLLLFLLPMSLYAITLLISSLSSGRKKLVDRIDHEYRVTNWRPEHYPSVDVFLPSAGEPLEILANTFHHVRAMEWPGELNVWVLDDSARHEVADLALEHGFIYRSRANRGFLKKAGNLRYGYEGSNGDLIMILDADFVPRPEALYDLVPYFDESSTGIVQSPQFFDTDKKMGWLQRCAGATQELFYRWIQPARDRSNAAICVGTCAVYRRAALQRSGGFAQIGHSEDVHTGVNLMKVGFLVRYVPIIISKGLCPDTVSGFLNQQYRWCTGSMSLLADKGFHKAQHITFRQRLSFWSGFLYYISTGLNAFVAPLPALAMLYFLPQWIEPMNSIWLLGALSLWFLILPAVMKGRWRVDVLRVQSLYSFAHAVAIVHMLTGRTKEWVATGAANTRTTPLAVTIGRTTQVYLGLSYGLLWFGLVRGAMNYGFDRYWAMIALAVLSSFIHYPLLFIDTRNRKVAPAPLASSEVPMPRSPLAYPMKADTAEIPPIKDTQVLPPQAPGVRRFRPDIQGLRAIAVVLVVLYHANVPFIRGGYVGVDVFFVISGFLITGQLMREVDRNGRISYLAFYANRFRRLLPPAVVVLLVTLVAARIFGSLFQFKSIATHAVYTAAQIINYRLASEGVDYQNAAGPESPLQHFWSLAVEEQFYLLWPLMIGVCVVIGRRYRTALIATLLAAVVTVSLYFSITVTATNAPLAYFSLHTRAWELGVGALVALAAARLNRQPRWFACLASWAGVALVLGTGLFFTDATAFPGSAATLPVAGSALVILAGCRQSRWSAETLLNRRPMQGIGAVSYSWYLWHWPMIILVPILFGHSFKWWENIELMVIALWIATLSYWVIESPVRRTALRKRLWLSAGVSMSSCVAITATLLIVTMPALVGAGAATVAISLDGNSVAQVRKAVGLGTQILKVPSNLTPSLDQARLDQPVTSKNGCHLDYTMTDAPSKCVYGDREGKHVAVLVGDSHGQQWLPALDKAARDQGWKLIAWTKAACPIADVKVFNTALNRDFTECGTFRDKIIDRINLMSPDLVLVGQSDSVPGKSVTNLGWSEATARSLGRFQQKKIPVVYIADTPYHGSNVPDCIARNLDDVGACTIKRNDAAPYDGRATQMIETLKAANIAVVDPTDWFCTRADCPAVIGNLLVYRDESHISTGYSYYLAPLFRPFFTK